MAQVPTTGCPSKVSAKSTVNNREEVDLEKIFKVSSSDQYPILVSPKILRRKGAGQIDHCFYHQKKDKIILIEMKRSRPLSEKQKRRLKKSAIYLSCLFDVSIECRLVIGQKRSFKTYAF